MVKRISEREFIRSSHALRSSGMKKMKVLKEPKIPFEKRIIYRDARIKDKDILHMPKMVVISLSKKETMNMLKSKDKKSRRFHTFRSRYGTASDIV